MKTAILTIWLGLTSPTSTPYQAQQIGPMEAMSCKVILEVLRVDKRVAKAECGEAK